MNENIKIEKFKLDDLNLISHTLETDFDDFWSYNVLSKELQSPSSFYLCCKKNYEIVGFGGITITLDIAELNNIVIKKRLRGNGLSTIILKQLIEEAKAHDCTIINLEVASTNKVALGLYQKFGFKQVGMRSKYYNGTDAVLMSLNL